MFKSLKFGFVVAVGFLGVVWKVIQYVAEVAPDGSNTRAQPGPVSRDLTLALPDELTYDGQTVID